MNFLKDSIMMLFEMCPLCNMLCPDKMKPMVLCGLDKGMQCDVCNKSFELPDCKAIKETARQQRDNRYGK